MSARKRFRAGDRVRYIGLPTLGPKHGSVGTVSTVAGIRGRSVHPDPRGLMTFVDWDDSRAEGVYTQHLERATERPA